MIEYVLKPIAHLLILWLPVAFLRRRATEEPKLDPQLSMLWVMLPQRPLGKTQPCSSLFRVW